MSLIPFVTRYLGDSHGAPLAVAVYAGELALCCIAFYWLQSVLCHHNHGQRGAGTPVPPHAGKGGDPYWRMYLRLSVGVLSVRLRWDPGFDTVAYFLPDRNLLEV